VLCLKIVAEVQNGKVRIKRKHFRINKEWRTWEITRLGQCISGQSEQITRPEQKKALAWEDEGRKKYALARLLRRGGLGKAEFGQ
jgi:hypothetical protein